MSYEQSVATSELKRWGFWKGLQYAADGWPPSNTLAQIMSGRADRPGHRILVLEMPAEVWRINAAVMKLPTDYVAVLVSRYCLPVQAETGEPYAVDFLASLLGISPGRYATRLDAARRAYQGQSWKANERDGSATGVPEAR